MSVVILDIISVGNCLSISFLFTVDVALTHPPVVAA